MDESNTEEEVYQFYTVINDLVFDNSEQQESSFEASHDNEEVVYVTMPSENNENVDTQEDLTYSEESTVSEDSGLPVSSNLKFMTLSDGQIYLTTDDPEDNLTSIQPQLLSVPEDELNNDFNEEEEVDDPVEDEEGYHEIRLEDGTTALIDANLFKLIKVSEVAPQVMHTKTKRHGGFICTYVDCGKTFTSAHHLSVHTRLHTRCRPYSCAISGCDKTFVTNYSLKAHTRTHTGEKPYGCAICSKHFKTAGDLQKHVRTHTGEKPFKCPVEGCDKSFSTSNIRKVHVRSHTGERPYVCTISDCGKAFSSATNYKNHIRIHSGEKPYSCTVEGCGKRFTEYSSLYKHKAVHEPVTYVKCNYNDCYQLFKSEGLLKHHKRMMHNIVYISGSSSRYLLPKKDDKSLMMTQLTQFN